MPRLGNKGDKAPRGPAQLPNFRQKPGNSCLLPAGLLLMQLLHKVERVRAHTHTPSVFSNCQTLNKGRKMFLGLYTPSLQEEPGDCPTMASGRVFFSMRLLHLCFLTPSPPPNVFLQLLALSAVFGVSLLLPVAFWIFPAF